MLTPAGSEYLRVLKDQLTGRSQGGGSGEDPAAETMIGLDRLGNVQDCVTGALAARVPGDLMEAGAWRGGTAILMRAVLGACGDQVRRVFVADSFRGMPPNDAVTQGLSQGLGAGEMAVSEAAVRASFAKYGLLDDRVVFVPGWFADTLPGPAGQLAVLHVDADLYSSTLEALTGLYPVVAPGGYVIVDDYHAFPFCKAAVDEFRAVHAPAPMHDGGGPAVWWRKPGGP